jgi:putative flippase GtrA
MISSIFKLEFVRFLFIGVLNTLFYYMIYGFFLFLDFHYIIAVFMATVLGVLFSFKTFGKFVFFNENKNRIVIFILVYGVLFLINILFITLINVYVDDYYVAGFLAIFPYVFFSYFLNKKFVFLKDN